MLKTYAVAAALVLAPVVLPAPARADSPQAGTPDFSGVWTFAGTTPQPSSGGGAAAMKPEPLTIRQTSASISIVRTAFGQATTMTFTIGGPSDDTNRTGAQVWTTKTRWDGTKLLTAGRITQNTSAGFEEWAYTETRTLDARGHMIVGTRYVAQDGKVTEGMQDWAPRKSPRPRPMRGRQP